MDAGIAVYENDLDTYTIDATANHENQIYLRPWLVCLGKVLCVCLPNISLSDLKDRVRRVMSGRLRNSSLAPS